MKSFWNILESVLLKIHNVSPTHSLKEMENLSKNFPEEDINVESNDSNNSFRSSLEKFGSDNGITLDIVLTHIY